jgi:pimeloyl-ACP methyl ester carboxylesterase
VGAAQHDITVDGRELTVYRTTAPDAAAGAPTFVMVHGIGVSHRYFGRLRDELRGVGNTLTLDLPGFGRSPKPDGPWSVEQYAAFIGHVLDHEGVTGAVLIGHSMGAQFVTELAGTRPELVSHTVLIGPVTDPRRATAVQQGLALARDTLKEPVAGNFMVFSDYLRCGVGWYTKELVPMLGYRTDLAIGRASSPVLVLRGGKDPVASSEWCSLLASQAADGTIVEVGDRRHLVQFSAPGETARAITEFVGLELAVEAPSA